MTEVYVTIPKPKVKELSSFNATAYFRDGDSSATPAASAYRIDCLTTGKEILDWTSLTPAVSNIIAIASSYNAIQSCGNKTEKKQLTVTTDKDLSTQTRNSITWIVENNLAY